eukprot:gnl/MRDRNA2_/MRDRNA2_114101_c0_seq1.p1 gnl/MRDRNA2_/MRDRNA2_114101_c0~~gnl/MRDRNA2_/MRDRNA2_114101_c0_seq1.p1  ORF type:complete len:157 (+),score=14.67 gnl/MRDRNA2_/MRDRNA2_114101_c0_seq1:161-631(+)
MTFPNVAAMLPLTLIFSVVVGTTNADAIREKHNFRLHHGQAGIHSSSQSAPELAKPLAISHGSLIQEGASDSQHHEARGKPFRTSKQTQLALLQQRTHQTRLRRLESNRHPSRGGQYIFGLPKIVVVIVADVLAMMVFLACIPMLLSCAKRRKLFS